MTLSAIAAQVRPWCEKVRPWCEKVRPQMRTSPSATLVRRSAKKCDLGAKKCDLQRQLLCPRVSFNASLKLRKVEQSCVLCP